MKTQDNHDEFIRKLISASGAESAPASFTDRVMERIKAEPAADDTPLLSTGTWIAIIAGLAATIVVIFMVDIPFFDRVFSSEGIQKVSMDIFSNGFFSTMLSFFKSLNISNITWMIIAAALGLVVLDRLLRKRFSERGLLMII
jgi:hypothetical protein